MVVDVEEVEEEEKKILQRLSRPNLRHRRCQGRFGTSTVEHRLRAGASSDGRCEPK